VTTKYVVPMPSAVDRPAPASAPAMRAESIVARERPSAPIRCSGGIVSPMSVFRMTRSFGRTTPARPAIRSTRAGVRRSAKARPMRSAASPA
jgi:hypothetical protein